MVNISWLKKIAIILGVIAIIIALLKFFISHVPDFKDYDKQKEYAYKMHVAANKPYEWYLGAMLKEYLKNAIGEDSWIKSLNAHLFVIQKYNDRAMEDTEVLGRTANSYLLCANYTKAIEFYERQLKIFKDKYFKKSYTEKMAKPKQLQKLVEIEEYRYVVDILYDMARCYRAKRQYEKALEKFDEILTLLPETEGWDVSTRYKVFENAFRGRGVLLILRLKDFEKAMDNYEILKNVFSNDSLYYSWAIISQGDVYLAMGDIEKAKEKYNNVLFLDKSYEYADKTTARERLRELQLGEILTEDGITFKIKNGKVTVE